MSKKKYITFSGFPPADIAQITFNTSIDHGEMANRIGIDRSEILGAGFCEHDGEFFRCYGGSKSLGIESDPEIDEKLMNRKELK